MIQAGLVCEGKPFNWFFCSTAEIHSAVSPYGEGRFPTFNPHFYPRL